MVRVLRPQPDARAVVEPEPALLRLLPRHFQPLPPPDPLHPLAVHPPAGLAQQRGDPAVAVAAVAPRQLDDVLRPKRQHHLSHESRCLPASKGSRDRRGLLLEHARAPIHRRLHRQAQPCGEAGGHPGVLEDTLFQLSRGCVDVFLFHEIRRDLPVQLVQDQNELFMPCGYLAISHQQSERTCIEPIWRLR
jgi:hypothetical protein